MAKIIEINNVASFVILSGGGSLLRAFNKINKSLSISTPLEGECVMEGLYIRAREERLMKRRDGSRRGDFDSLLNEVVSLGMRRGPRNPSPFDADYGFYNEYKKVKKPKNQKKQGKNVFLINGMGGLSYDKIDRYKELMEKESDLIDGSCVIYVMRGRNDDARLFEEGILDSPNVKFISDYTVLKFDNGVCCLCVGGAVSMNMSWLKSVGKYNENEAPVFNRKELDEAFSKCDGINCLITGFPNPETRKKTVFGEKWYKVDKDLRGKVHDAGKSIGSIVDYIIYKGCDMFLWSIGNTSINYSGASKRGWTISSTMASGINSIHPFDTYAVYKAKRQKAEQDKERAKQSKEMKKQMQGYTSYHPFVRAVSSPYGYTVMGSGSTVTVSSGSATLMDVVNTIHRMSTNDSASVTLRGADDIPATAGTLRSADTISAAVRSAVNTSADNAFVDGPDSLGF